MKHVIFSTAHVPWPYERQTFHGDGRHDSCNFLYNPGSAEQGDALVVFDEPHQTLRTQIPKQKRLLFVGEPPSIKSYHPAYLNQFGTVVCPYPLPGFTGEQIVSHAALPWHFGIDRSSAGNQKALEWRELAAMEPPAKTRALSVLCSNKAFTEGHRLRLTFLDALKRRFPGEVDIFGRGFAPVADKAQAILPYRYHLVLENNDTPGFWTEKLADAFLGYSFPLFSGCPDIFSYFSQDSLVAVDIRRKEQALDSIAALLQQDDYAARAKSVALARKKILYEYNMFSIVEAWLQTLPPSGVPSFLETLFPNVVVGRPDKWRDRLLQQRPWHRFFPRLWGRIQREFFKK